MKQPEYIEGPEAQRNFEVEEGEKASSRAQSVRKLLVSDKDSDTSKPLQNPNKIDRSQRLLLTA